MAFSLEFRLYCDGDILQDISPFISQYEHNESGENDALSVIVH